MPTKASHSANAETGSVVIKAPAACTWKAISLNNDWLTITVGQSGNGEGTVNYSVTENESLEERTGTLSIEDQTFIITQLAPPPPDKVRLTVIKNGDGNGLIIGDGMDCGEDCTNDYNQDDSQPVTLTAVPSEDSYFEGWSGGCTSTETTCTVTMVQDQTVTATFGLNNNEYPLRVITDGSGTGNVNIVITPTETKNCEIDCKVVVQKDALVGLKANQAEGYQFVGWNGDCFGINETCIVFMEEAKFVTATFEPPNENPLNACFEIKYDQENPLQIEADASCSDNPESAIFNYQWTTSDSETGKIINDDLINQQINFTLDKQGRYKLTLTVTDENGATGTYAQSINIDKRLVFSGMKPLYKIGEKIEVDLIENLEVSSRFARVDLWVVIQLPENLGGSLIYRVPELENGMNPFSPEQKAFKTSLEKSDTSHRILDFEITPGLGGDYTVYAAYVEEGKNPMTDGFIVLRSNLTNVTITLRER
ncbi:hypothetical protein BGP_0026 [Beggiatoa sp. PS]|nr:hypothetical protein BGP_0026 [Beggiatoa sp. PS]